MRFLSAFQEAPEIEQRNSFVKIKGKTTFADLTVDELLTEFGGRNCKSMEDYQKSTLEPDPRGTRTYPLTTSAPVEVDDPPKPLGPILLNNVYAEPKPKNQLKQLKPDLARNKKIQCGGPHENDLHRSDADAISTNLMLAPIGKMMNRRKSRGRKNRYFEQIDREDHNAGAILDSDDETD